MLSSVARRLVVRHRRGLEDDRGASTADATRCRRAARPAKSARQLRRYRHSLSSFVLDIGRGCVTQERAKEANVGTVRVIAALSLRHACSKLRCCPRPRIAAAGCTTRSLALRSSMGLYSVGGGVQVTDSICRCYCACCAVG